MGWVEWGRPSLGGVGEDCMGFNRAVTLGEQMAVKRVISETD